MRKLLSDRCQSSRTRTSEFSSEAPCDWRPTQVSDPNSGEPFTDEGAWLWVGELISGGVEIEMIVLEKPKGKTGYVIKQPVGARVVYVKLQLLSATVFGRSFHYSETSNDRAK
ncbi:MAG: hypothetical protein QM817_25795 [Archangium sp.]